MTQQDRQRVWPVYEAACELPPSERAAFVKVQLAEDELRAKVIELLETADTPLDSGPSPEVQFPTEWERVGQTLGRFQLLAPVGRGGMGEVYEALDPELGRHVAIKCIRSRRLETSSAVEALTREARAASALNHPCVVTIFEVIRSGDTIGIVMELVEGQALRKLTGRPHPLSQVAVWGQRIAEALAATHARGIIHRDVKPENVILRSDGYVKVLDFGLAAQNTLSASVTPMGTLRYMSPEQSAIRPLTPATDIFSLGVVLYELATGVHPFAPEGPNTSTLTVVQATATEDAPPPSAIVRGLPRAFDALILQMLDKDPASRPSATEVARRLASLPTRHRGRLRLAVGALLAAAALAAAYGIREHVPSASQPVELRGTLLTGSPGKETHPAFSPDSHSVVYAWDGGKGGKRDIWVKGLGSGDPRRITSDPADESDPCWAAGGSVLVFLREAPLAYQVIASPVAGGAERIVTTIANTQKWIEHRLACSPVAAQVVVSDDPPHRPGNQHLYVVSLSTGQRRVLTTAPPQSYDVWPRVSPDGRRFAYVRGDSELRVISIDGGESRLLVTTQYFGGLAWSSDGKSIVYQVGSADPKNVWQVPAGGGVPVRPPFTLELNARDIALSPDGRKVAYSLGARVTNIWRVFASGAAPIELAPSTRPDTDAAWSPDGKSIVFASDRSGWAELWVASATGTNVRAITNLKTGVGSPAWSPDGQWVAFDSSQAGHTRIGLAPAAGGTGTRMLTDGSEDCVPSWSQDGRWIYFCSARSGSRQIWRAPSAGGGAIQITREGGFESRESPDGQFLYYSKWGANGIWRLHTLGDSSREEKVADFDPAVQFRCWDISRRGIYIASQPKPSVDVLPFPGGRRRVATLPGELPKFGRCLAVHPDGQSFLFPVADADLSEIYVGDYPGPRAK